MSEDENDITFRGYIEKHYAPLGENEAWEARRVLRDAVHYNDLMRYETIFPKHQKIVLRLLDKYMGYYPARPALLKYSPDVRQEVENYLRDKIDHDTFKKNAISHLKKMRRLDLEYGNWLVRKTVEQSDIDRYMTHLAPYRQQARDRLAKHIEYYPDLNYSLGAEIFLRKYIASDKFNPEWTDHPADFKAMQITLYREALMKVGQEYADNSPLMACNTHIKIFC